MNDKYEVTVFTPLYNRANMLRNIYESLLKNTKYRLEWLIIDDGSTDEPEPVLYEIRKECPDEIDIRYIRKQNGGKHTAYNLALEKANGRYFVCLDSDDTIVNNALNETITLLKTNIEPAVSGIITLKKDKAGKLLSGIPSKSIKACTIFDLMSKYGGLGEYAFIFKTDVAKRYPFPVFAGEKFISESVVYNKMSIDAIKFLYSDIVLMECEYQAGGLSATIIKNQKNCPSGFAYEYIGRTELPITLYKRIIDASKYWAFVWLSGNKKILNVKKSSIIFLGIPLGAVAYLFYRIRFFRER